MIEAAGWGFLAGFALVIGALVGVYLDVPRRAVGLVMAFGAGVLISALAFDLTQEAFNRAGSDAVALGLAAGALVFFAGDWLIDRRGGEHRKRSGEEQADGSPGALALGAVLDGIPESVVIGVSLLAQGTVSVAVLVAVFLSNVPESLSAATGMRKAGRSKGVILALWVAVSLSSAVAAGLGYTLLGEASPDIIAAMEAFAAGAILTMLVDTMMPEAVASGGKVAGLATVLGFAAAFFLSALG